ncbi:MAG: SLC45 family MFS transporter [Chloroflexi bacterium]|nr:MAG: SLC45 family MFS transporter [Chloroflexota bacterium]
MTNASAQLALEDDLNDIEALQVPTKAVNAGFQMLLSLANLVIWLSILPISQILLPTQIAALGAANKFTNLTIATVVGVLAAVITNPIAGALSDRTTSRLGRRRPWFLVGSMLSAVTLALMANATSFVALVIWWAIFHIAANAILAGLSAVVPDQVPLRQRATVSAFVSLSLPLGAVMGALLVTRVATSTQMSYYIFIGLLLVVMMLFILVLRDKPLPKEAAPRFHLATFLAGFWVNPVKYPDFGWAWLTRFLVYLSYFTALGYLLYFLQDAVHYQKAAQGVTTFQIILTGTLLLSSVASGVLSDRLQRRKVFVVGASLVIALSFLILAFFQTWLAVELAGGVLGLGFGAYLGVDIALITQLLPSANSRGKDLGVINIANAFPQIVGVSIAATVVNTFHSYTLLFVLAAILALLGAGLIQRIKSVR